MQLLSSLPARLTSLSLFFLPTLDRASSQELPEVRQSAAGLLSEPLQKKISEADLAKTVQILKDYAKANNDIQLKILDGFTKGQNISEALKARDLLLKNTIRSVNRCLGLAEKADADLSPENFAESVRPITEALEKSGFGVLFPCTFEVAAGISVYSLPCLEICGQGILVPPAAFYIPGLIKDSKGIEVPVLKQLSDSFCPIRTKLNPDCAFDIQKSIPFDSLYSQTSGFLIVRDGVEATCKKTNNWFNGNSEIIEFGLAVKLATLVSAMNSESVPASFKIDGHKYEKRQIAYMLSTRNFLKTCRQTGIEYLIRVAAGKSTTDLSDLTNQLLKESVLAFIEEQSDRYSVLGTLLAGADKESRIPHDQKIRNISSSVKSGSAVAVFCEIMELAQKQGRAAELAGSFYNSACDVFDARIEDLRKAAAVIK